MQILRLIEVLDVGALPWHHLHLYVWALRPRPCGSLWQAIINALLIHFDEKSVKFSHFIDPLFFFLNCFYVYDFFFIYV